LAAGGNGIVKYFDLSAAGDSTFSRFYQSGNIPELTNEHCTYDGVNKVNDFSQHISVAMPWTIPYQYSTDSASGLVNTIPNGAGSGKNVNTLVQ
jgi:hypothetical protein